MTKILVLASVLALIFVVLFNIDNQFCSNHIIAEYPSPNGKLKAVVFSRECGATVGFNTQISLIAKDASLGNEGGNLLSADGNHETVPPTSTGGPTMELAWRDDSTLSISHHPKTRFFKEENFLRGVKIYYVPLQSQ